MRRLALFFGGMALGVAAVFAPRLVRADVPIEPRIIAAVLAVVLLVAGGGDDGPKVKPQLPLPNG